MSDGSVASSCSTKSDIRANWASPRSRFLSDLASKGVSASTQNRVLECAELRVKDVHLERGEVLIRDGKGGKDRVTEGRGRVALPDALTMKYPNASRE